MDYKIRKLEIADNRQALEEFSKIGATIYGQRIMAKKIFPLALKVKDIDVRAANILKQEMLARDGDVVTSRDTLVKAEGLTDVIILGGSDSIENLAEKIKQQPFGLKKLSVVLVEYLRSIKEKNSRKVLNIAGRSFDLESEGPLIMGILNITSDSFYDGGKYLNKSDAERRISEIAEEGAHIVDIGGLSTRPGSLPVSVEEEMERAIPVIQLAKKNSSLIISADTYRSEVALQAIKSGADMINDISGLTFDENMARTVGSSDAWVVLMHIKGTPGTMQQDPYYDDVIDEIYNFLYAQAQKAIEAGIKAERIMIDPGIGFGKSIANNLNIIAKLNEFRNMGYPVMLGASRKSFIGHILDSAPASERLEGSLAAAVCGFLNGADILRVHDVKQTVKAVKIANRIKNYNV